MGTNLNNSNHLQAALLQHASSSNLAVVIIKRNPLSLNHWPCPVPAAGPGPLAAAVVPLGLLPLLLHPLPPLLIRQVDGHRHAHPPAKPDEVEQLEQRTAQQQGDQEECKGGLTLQEEWERRR